MRYDSIELVLGFVIRTIINILPSKVVGMLDSYFIANSDTPKLIKEYSTL